MCKQIQTSERSHKLKSEKGEDMGAGDDTVGGSTDKIPSEKQVEKNR